MIKPKLQETGASLAMENTSHSSKVKKYVSPPLLWPQWNWAPSLETAISIILHSYPVQQNFIEKYCLPEWDADCAS